MHNFEFLWEMVNGDLGSFIVDNVDSIIAAHALVVATKPEIMDSLIEVLIDGN